MSENVFSKLPPQIMLKITQYLSENLNTVSNLSVTSKSINNYYKNEPLLLQYIIHKLVEDMHIQKYLVKTYKQIIDINLNVHTQSYLPQ